MPAPSSPPPVDPRDKPEGDGFLGRSRALGTVDGLEREAHRGRAQLSPRRVGQRSTESGKQITDAMTFDGKWHGVADLVIMTVKFQPI